MSTPRANWSEQNPADWWTAAVSAISDVLTKGHATGSDVTCVGLTGQMHVTSDHEAILFSHAHPEKARGWLEAHLIRARAGDGGRSLKALERPV